jgi:hypothetical protein
VAVPLSSLLPALRPHLDGLVGDRAWHDIKRLADRLPPRVWPDGSIEVRLGPGERRVDFLVCAQGPAGKEALADAFAAGARLPAGERVQPLVEEWVDPGTLLGGRSSILWIEHDLPEGQVGPPLIFFGGFDLPSLGQAASPAEVRALVQRSRQLLSGEAGEAQLEAVERCTRTLPPDGQVRHIAALETARPTEDVRYVAVLAYDQAWSWLQEIGWPGERCHWDLALAALGPGWSQLQIHLDVGETVRPDLGVEFFLTEPPTRTRRWQKFIQRLVEMGVADERCAAVPEWIGEEAVRLPGETWLSRIQRQSMIKLVLDAGGGLSAKAYLSFSARYSLF